jgi:hypothetical protein
MYCILAKRIVATSREPCRDGRPDPDVAVPVIVLSAVSLFVDRGPFQFGGAIDVGGAIPALVWNVALSLVMMRKAVTP